MAQTLDSDIKSKAGNDRWQEEVGSPPPSPAQQPEDLLLFRQEGRGENHLSPKLAKSLFQGRGGSVGLVLCYHLHGCCAA